MTFDRPLIAAANAWSRINWRYWLVRFPMFLLAIPAAYGVGSFAAIRLPVYVAIFAGFAFECSYIGAIAAADQARDPDDTATTALWWLVNLFAVLASVASNLLFFSGTYSQITLESATHAVPLPILGFFYGLLVHRVASKDAALADSESARLAAIVYCRYCGAECKNQHAEYSHFRTCPKHPSRA
jgi:hypothetical protein